MRFPPHEPLYSGAQALIGYDIDLTAPDGTATITLDLDDKHRNRNGTLHGGIHAMMLDAAAGFAASRYLAQDAPQVIPVLTLSLTTNFLAPAIEGVVTTEGHVTGGGRNIIYAAAQMTDSGGAVVSTATGVFKRTSR